MKSTKGLLLVAIVLFASLFFAFTSNSHPVNLITQKQKLLSAVGQLLEEQHYSPKAINDSFSRQVFKKYLGDLDPEKTLFIQSDINELRKYETTLDDEIHGADIKFVPAVNPIYEKRTNEVMALYKEILSKPFDFTTNETIVTDPEKMNYPANEAELRDRWRKKLKYFTLERYVQLTDERDKAKEGDSIKLKTNAQFEKQAREATLKTLNRYYDHIKATETDDERFDLYINTITNLMDPHSDYFPPVEKRAFDEMMSGRFYGIGAQLAEQAGVIKIASIVPGGPAWKSGEIVTNDIILKVAQGQQTPVDISGFETQDAVKLIRGDKGTEVKLTIKKQDGTIKVISLIREKIEQDEAFARSAIIKNGNDKIGYIWLSDFYANFEEVNGHRCSQDVAQEINKLKAEDVKGIVLDIRTNGGGSLYEVVQMVGLFIGQGPIVQVRDKDGKSTVLSDRDNSVLYDGPLAVMVNEGSASASEIFAAAIQDYKRGVIVGSSSTYGKGTVQKTVPLGRPTDMFSGKTEYGAVKLTFQKFYRVNGGSTQLKGVTPDIILPDEYEYLKIREKDNPSALPWDEIGKSPFQPWQGKFDYNSFVKKENDQVSRNTVFNQIKTNTEWIGKNIDNPVSLNLDKYKEQQKQLRTIGTETNNLIKLSTDLDAQVPEPDKDKFYNNPDKAKGDRYQAWLKNVKKDAYIDQTLKIVSDMIAAPAMPTASK